MEASAIHARNGLGRNRVTIATPLLRLRSDQQLIAIFRAGSDDAFRVMHDRYRQRLLAYMRQMLVASPSDAEDLLQDVFVRAYRGLRSNDRELSLRPWLYRIARNRCVDELRRPTRPTNPELLELTRPQEHDPVVESEQRETLRRLVIDVGRLPEQQRSALLLREMSGMSYAHVADVLGVSVPAVKSLLVRARIGLAQALDARDTACDGIRDEVARAHASGVRPNALARRHLRDCAGCREYRAEVRGVSEQLAALAPTIGPLALLAKLVGVGGGTGGGAAAGGAAAAGGTAGTSGAVASAGLMGIGAGHVTALVAAVVITAGGAVDLAAHAASAPVHHSRAATKRVSSHVVRTTAARVVDTHRSRHYSSHGGGSGPATAEHSGSESGAGSATHTSRSTGGVVATSSTVRNSNGTDTFSQGGSGTGTAPCVAPASPQSTNLVTQILTAVAQPSTPASATDDTCTTSGSQTGGTAASGTTGTSSGTTGTGSTGTASTGTGTTGTGSTGTSSTGTGSTGTGDTGTGSAGTGSTGTGTGSTGSTS